jgi:hypothetical protein
LPAAVKAAPALTDIVETDDTGYVIVHCKLEGFADPPSVRVSVAGIAGATVADDKLSEAV